MAAFPLPPPTPSSGSLPASLATPTRSPPLTVTSTAFVRETGTFPDTTTALGRGLSAELWSSLRCHDVPADEPLTAFADRTKRLDDSIRRDKVSSASPPRPAPRPSPTTDNTPDDTPRPPSSESRPRQLLSPEERARRFKAGLCPHCGQAGHLANACPNCVAGATRAARFHELRAAALSTTNTPAPVPTPPAADPQQSGNGSA